MRVLVFLATSELWSLFLALFILLSGTSLVYWLLSCLRGGVAPNILNKYGDDYDRDMSPAGFWFNIFLLAISGTSAIAIGIYLIIYPDAPFLAKLFR